MRWQKGPLNPKSLHCNHHPSFSTLLISQLFEWPSRIKQQLK